MLRKLLNEIMMALLAFSGAYFYPYIQIMREEDTEYVKAIVFSNDPVHQIMLETDRADEFFIVEWDDQGDVV